MSIKIPNNGKFAQANNSDLFGNISATRNINFDEEGYLKLSSRTALVISEDDDNDFGIPISFGRDGTEFHIITTDRAFDFQTNETSFGVSEDGNSNSPTLSYDSWGTWFQNRWHASTNTKIWYTTGGSWTDTSVSLTSGYVHPMEVFRNKVSMAVGNGNTVKLLDTSYATTLTLTLPTDYEVIGMAYNNAKMGIVTMMSDSAAGQNQEAYFFVWDGGTTSAGQGFPVGSDTIMGIRAYKSTWVIITRTGELKMWNGGGFTPLSELPFYYTQGTWGDSQNRETHGDTMLVDGSVLYLNVGNDLDSFGKKGESYLPNNPAGVWCYDPSIGLYHRYSPSISHAYRLTVPEANVNTSADILTASFGTIPATGNPIKQISDPISPIGIQFGRVYFIIRHNATEFSLAETYQDAIDGNKVDITTATDCSFLALDQLDFGASYFNRSGGLGLVQTREEQTDHLVMGVEIYKHTGLADNTDALCITVPGFENRGYAISSKILSQNIEDNAKKIYIRYRPLEGADKIIVKYKNKDVLGLPTSTPHYSSSTTCQWTDTNTFTTTADLSEAKAYLDSVNDDGSTNELEVEIISGAGAGAMAQVSSISFSTGTYTVNLAETITGAAATYYSNIVIDNWKKIGEITPSDTNGWKEFSVANAGKWIKYKIELRGYETTIEDLQIVNDVQIPAE